MAKIPSLQGFSFGIGRVFVPANTDAFELIHFKEIDVAGDNGATFEAPHNWSAESASLLAEAAACRSIPASTRLIEENTVPSWLWQRAGEDSLRTEETSASQIFHRVAGAATYNGWKKDIFAHEAEARAFFDETCFLLTQRMIAIDPRHLADQGLNWAYGLASHEPEMRAASAPAAFESGGFGLRGKPAIAEIRNSSIDALLGGHRDTKRKWNGFLGAGEKSGYLALRFTDIAADWAGTPAAPARAAIDLLTFRREDGSVDIDRLRHAVKLLVLLFELQDAPTGVQNVIGFTNLAPLLMSQALAYDSEAGRATAAAITAIITAEAYATSAKLAALLGPSLDFAANRESVVRALRNHRRAAYGDRNDYEKVSVLPVPLSIKDGIDLALVAEARRLWDGTLELALHNGLRFTRLTDLAPAPSLAFFMESASEGIAPMPALALPRATEAGNYVREIHPAVGEALHRLGYGSVERRAIIAHIAGMFTLADAPQINHTQLRRRGFDEIALQHVEDYLPQVNDIRLAFTQWNLGEEFCRDILEIPEDKLSDVRFDLLQHLGFSVRDIAAANTYCYGHGTAVGAKGLRPAHTAIFTHAREVTADARIRMAAAVQALISGDAGLQIAVPATAAEESGRYLLTAWRQGVKSLAIEFAAGMPATRQRATSSHKATKAAKPARRIHAPQAPHPGLALRSTLRGKHKASGEMVGQQKAGGRKRGSSGRPSGKSN